MLGSERQIPKACSIPRSIQSTATNVSSQCEKANARKSTLPRLSIGMVLALETRPLVHADRLLQALQTSPSEILTASRQAIQKWHLRKGDLACGQCMQLHDRLLLVLTHRTSDHITTVLTGANQPDTGTWNCQVRWLHQSSVILRSVAVKVPERSQHSPAASMETQPCCSNTLSLNNHCFVGSFSVYSGCVHVYGMTSDDSAIQHIFQDTYDFTEAAEADQYQAGNKVSNS